MKKAIIFALTFLSLNINIFSQSPSSGNVGFGIILGEPTGLTLKAWNSSRTAWAFSVGNSYFGALRITGDYLWHFNAFNSNVVTLYAGPGIAVGIGESGGWFYSRNGKDIYYVRDDNGIGVGGRGIFGINIVPRNTPLEFFAEIGVLVGVVPSVGARTEGAIGFRFYP